jgi:hypothetical protein
VADAVLGAAFAVVDGDDDVAVFDDVPQAASVAAAATRDPAAMRRGHAAFVSVNAILTLWPRPLRPSP